MKHTNEFDEAKAAELIAYIASKVDIGKTKLMKLLYLIDFIGYEKTGQPITNATYEHWTYGPVPKEVYNGIQLLKDDVFDVERIERCEKPYEKFVALRSPNLENLFSKEEREVIDEVLHEYGALSARDLVDMAHKELPWMLTESQEKIPYFLAAYRTSEPLLDEELREIQENKSYIQRILNAFGITANDGAVPM